MPSNHFTETDLQTHWTEFLEEIQRKDSVLYNAINGFRLVKFDEDTITVHYPSDTAKSEFDKVSGHFFNIFKHKVNHHNIIVDYKNDASSLKKEIVTKKSLFEKYVKINPLLKDLDDLLKFDLH